MCVSYVQVMFCQRPPFTLRQVLCDVPKLFADAIQREEGLEVCKFIADLNHQASREVHHAHGRHLHNEQESTLITSQQTHIQSTGASLKAVTRRFIGSSLDEQGPSI